MKGTLKMTSSSLHILQKRKDLSSVDESFSKAFVLNLDRQEPYLEIGMVVRWHW